MTKAEWRIDGFTVTSWGNGESYKVTRGGLDAFFRGDDATGWRADYDAADSAGRLDAFLGQTMRDYGEPNGETLLADMERLDEAARIADYDPDAWEDSDDY